MPLRKGINVRFADPRQPETFAALINERTKTVFCESVGNPLGNVTDFAKLAEIAHAHGVPLIADNTVPSPYLCRPIEHGAEIVVHSLTKYLGGHGNSVGAAISPMNAFLILQGIETLALRMDRICDNALAIAQQLKNHPKVAWVNYAGLSSHPEHALVQKYMNGKASGIVSFGLKSQDADKRAAGARFLDALGLFTRLVNIGDAKSLATHPASTTHRQLDAAELAKAGVSEDIVRLLIGIEHIDDLMANLEQALAAA
jgi:O-acetylhomoserine (thiol)-lyase